MEVKVGSARLNWCQSSLPHSPPSSQTLASVFSSPSSKRRPIDNASLTWPYLHRSALFGSASNKLYRCRSCEHPKSKARTVKRGCSASLDAFSDEEFSKKIQELALRFQLSDDDENYQGESDKERNSEDNISTQNSSKRNDFGELEMYQTYEPYFVEPSNWQASDDIIPASIERKANSVDLPLSLRIIKRKKQWQEGFREAGESACCSVKKAFSSMVFIIRELQSYSLQMREILFYQDLQGILVRVQKEMNASFVWLFQQVFSHTPTLMVYVMILLANYSVHSMSTNPAIAVTAPPEAQATVVELASVEEKTYRDHKFDSSAIKTYSVSSSSGKTSSIGGNNGGGGGKIPVVGSGMDGDGRYDGSVSSDYHGTILPDGVSSIGNPARTSENEVVSSEEEASLWNSITEEAGRMQAAGRNEALDQETMQRFVSPVTAKIETDDYEDYFRTELLYQMGLLQEPSNTLLLANYAQFLFLVAQDYDRAEHYFKRAAKVEPKDPEALSKYASFLWQARNDLWAAEETYLEAISVDPTNSYYAANYAHFLFSTGGEDTCFPLSSVDANADEV
ncbi:hypothetical protein LguiA_011991 [Lonicera macranthoides]